MVKNPNQFNNIGDSMKGDFKLDPAASILFVNSGNGSIISTVETGTLEITNQSYQYRNNGNNGDAAMFFDEKGYYYSKFYTPRDNWDAVQNRFNNPVIYVGRNFIFTRNAVYSKSAGTVLSYSPKYWHSAHVNAKNQVFLLDQDQKILRKYNSIDEVPKK